MSNQNICEYQAKDRKRYTDLIIRSTAKHKIIIAGPGTGKTFTFKELLKTKSGNNLALTFINNLAKDLQKELNQLADSYTFHAYCKKLLHKINVDGIDSNFHYFPKLPYLIEADAKIIADDLDRFQEAFQTLTKDERIAFYLKRGNYYNAVGHDDAVYRVLTYFQRSQTVLPSFSQIVVDEYQDFNALEVAFINELEKNNPILIVGDDDQAIYDFKNASPSHIRLKAIQSSFMKFDLPYCSRCTQVIVDAINDITNRANAMGKLQNRAKKKYLCFLPKKKEDSNKHPQIVHVNCTVQNKKCPYVAKFIEREINKISQKEIDEAFRKNYPCVLIIGPSHYTKQVYNYLKMRFTNIDYHKGKKEFITPFDGYKILLADKESNLGWRVILEYSNNNLKDKIVKETHDRKRKITNLLCNSFKKVHLAIITILEKIKRDEPLSTKEVREIKEKCNLSVKQVRKLLEKEDEDEQEVDETCQDKNVSIKITTINGSKGLEANYVFLIGMNNGNLPRNPRNPTDNEICQFIVGLTRTIKKCYLISNYVFGGEIGIDSSVFINWINSSRIEKIGVKATYFK